MNVFIKKSIPLVTDNFNKMDLDDKVEILEMMLPSMMQSHSLDEKLHLMQVALPLMLNGLEADDLLKVIREIVPTLTDMLKDKGVDFKLDIG